MNARLASKLRQDSCRFWIVIPANCDTSTVILPLRSVHRFAWKAAELSEAAQIAGKFDPVHQALLKLLKRNARLDESALDGVRVSARVQPTGSSSERVRHNVARDVETARRLGINEVPTFLLCLPGGKVIRLTSPESLRLFLR
jgi:hypothetical protein